MLRLLPVAGLLVLSACGAAERVAPAPGLFEVDIDDGSFVGAYDPAGWTRSEVQAQIAERCLNGVIADWTEVPRPDGVRDFTGTCG